MTLYKDNEGNIRRMYYIYIKNEYEIDFVTERSNDERFINFASLKEMVKTLENIDIVDDESFLKIFLDYPFLHNDEITRYTYYIRSDTDDLYEQMAVFNVDLIKASLGISSTEILNTEVFQKSVIESAVRISEYNIDSSMFNIIKEKNQYSLYLLVGNKRFKVENINHLKANILNENLKNICIFPFEYEESLRCEKIVDKIDRNEKLLFFIPKYLSDVESKILNKISREYEYRKTYYKLLKAETSIWGNYYIPCKSLDKRYLKKNKKKLKIV